MADKRLSDPDSAAFTDFSMFLAALPASLSPIREAVAWETMVAYKNACLEHMRFVNTEWSEIPKFWALQFDAVIEKQITEGIVTKERTKPAQWHGAASVLTMVRAYFAHAFRFGPPCWDNVIAEVLCVTLQSALIARQGDVGLSDNWVGSRHFMQYSHVDVRLHDQAQDAVFFAKFTMKESKDNRYESLHLAISLSGWPSYAASFPSDPGPLDGVQRRLIANHANIFLNIGTLLTLTSHT